jgi:hypothetical protein
MQRSATSVALCRSKHCGQQWHLHANVAATELRYTKCSKYCDRIAQVYFKIQNMNLTVQMVYIYIYIYTIRFNIN